MTCLREAPIKVPTQKERQQNALKYFCNQEVGEQLCSIYAPELVCQHFATAFHSGAAGKNKAEVKQRLSDPTWIYAFNTSIRLGMSVDGKNAHIIGYGSAYVFIPGVPGLRKLVLRQHKKMIEDFVYYKEQIDTIGRDPEYRELLPFPIKEDYHRVRNDPDRSQNPDYIQVALSKDLCKTFSKAQLDKKAGRAKARSAVWKEHSLEMYRKTAIKAFCKDLPLTDINGEEVNLYNIVEDDYVGGEQGYYKEAATVASGILGQA